MPELPEVETVARSLRPLLIGRRIASVATSGKALRRPIAKRELERVCVGAQVQSVDRIGKYLLINVRSDRSGDQTMLVHLGMSGRLTVTAGSAPRAPHTHLVLTLNDGNQLRYADARRFGVITTYAAREVSNSAELAGLGPDPLSAAFSIEGFFADLCKSRMAVKTFLLDQRRIAGLGNIYASEALYVACISPRRRADRMTRSNAKQLHAAIRAVLRAAIARRGTSFRDYVDGSGNGGDNQAFLEVYDRAGDPCRRCGTAIRRLVQGARSTFYCPRCQR